MRTSIDDPDLEIPEIDFSRAEWLPNPLASRPGEKTEIRLDGAVEYQLRLIPSTAVIGRFTATFDAWPAIISAVESGRSPRTLSLDAIGPDEERWHMGAGSSLIAFARVNNGESVEYTRPSRSAKPRRVAES